MKGNKEKKNSCDNITDGGLKAFSNIIKRQIKNLKHLAIDISK